MRCYYRINELVRQVGGRYRLVQAYGVRFNWWDSDELGLHSGIRVWLRRVLGRREWRWKGRNYRHRIEGLESVYRQQRRSGAEMEYNLVPWRGGCALDAPGMQSMGCFVL